MFLIKMSGGADLVRRLNDLPEAVSKKIMRVALKDAGEPIRQAMQNNAPRGKRTPHLADNIKVAAIRSGNSGEITMAIGPTRDIFWAGFQEFGTKHQPARPFARPAFDSQVDRVINNVGRALWDAIRKQAGTETGRSAGGVGNL